MAWVEDVAQAARESAGIVGEPSTEDWERLAEQKGVEIVVAPVPCPYFVQTERGPRIVVSDPEQIPHECGHLYLRPGGGNLLRFLWPGETRVERLARLHDQRDESWADRFAEALRGQ